MKAYEKLKVKVEKLVADFGKELDTRFRAIDEAAKSIEEDEKRIDQASDKGDLAAYSKAKADKQKHTDALEMAQKRQRKLQGNFPLISREEYEADTDTVKKELAEMCLEDKRKVVALCAQIDEIVKHNNAEINAANDVLRRFQGEVYRNADRRRQTPSGEYYLDPSGVNEFYDPFLSRFYAVAFKNKPYEDLCESVKQADAAVHKCESVKRADAADHKRETVKQADAAEHKGDK